MKLHANFTGMHIRIGAFTSCKKGAECPVCLGSAVGSFSSLGLRLEPLKTDSAPTLEMFFTVRKRRWGKFRNRNQELQSTSYMSVWFSVLCEGLSSMWLSMQRVSGTHSTHSESLLSLTKLAGPYQHTYLKINSHINWRHHYFYADMTTVNYIKSQKLRAKL